MVTRHNMESRLMTNKHDKLVRTNLCHDTVAMTFSVKSGFKYITKYEYKLLACYSGQIAYE